MAERWTSMLRPHQQGMALVFTLVMMALIAILVIEVQIGARASLRREQARLRALEVRQAAEDSARAALRRLADDGDLLVDATNDAWMAAEDVVLESGIAVRTTILDENRYFDLNNLGLPEEAGARNAVDVLADLLVLSGDFTGSALLSALPDWIDADSEGAMDGDFYGRRQPPYTAANRWLASLYEVRYVDGAKADMFERRSRSSSTDVFQASLADCVTAIPAPRRAWIPVNINTASPDTLRGVFGFQHESIVSTILTFRALKPIRSLQALSVMLEPAAFESLRRLIDVRSRYFTVQVRAYGGQANAELRVLAARDGAGHMEIMQWLY